MAGLYDADYISRFYDQYGEREWERFHRDPAGLVNLHTHLQLLREYIKRGDHVLDAGAGPGRFTIEMARLGATITVGDISPAQLDLNRRRVAEAGFEEQVVAREVVDIVDLSRFPSERFDAVVCYGGPLSYVFEQADRALAELLRVTRPGGYLLLSVMSLLGAMRHFLPGVLELTERYGLHPTEDIIATGDQVGVLAGAHLCHLFRWSELRALLERHPCGVVAASASNFLSVGGGSEERLIDLPERRELWEAFLRWETELCREPGAIDAGTHIIAVVQKHTARRSAP